MKYLLPSEIPNLDTRAAGSRQHELLFQYSSKGLLLVNSETDWPIEDMMAGPLREMFYPRVDTKESTTDLLLAIQKREILLVDRPNSPCITSISVDIGGSLTGRLHVTKVYNAEKHRKLDAFVFVEDMLKVLGLSYSASTAPLFEYIISRCQLVIDLSRNSKDENTRSGADRYLLIALDAMLEVMSVLGKPPYSQGWLSHLAHEGYPRRIRAVKKALKANEKKLHEYILLTAIQERHAKEVAERLSKARLSGKSLPQKGSVSVKIG